MEQMINIHSMAIQYATVAETKASRSELRSFAGNFATREQAEQDMMQEDLLKWYKIKYTPKPSSDFAQQLADFKAQSGKEFDTQFMEETISYENLELYVAQKLVRRATHADLKRLANVIISTDRKELSKLQSWLKSWGYHQDDDSREQDD